MQYHGWCRTSCFTSDWIGEIHVSHQNGCEFLQFATPIASAEAKFKHRYMKMSLIAGYCKNVACSGGILRAIVEIALLQQTPC
eukprot:6461573-Amphidinium_carterae.1